MLFKHTSAPSLFPPHSFVWIITDRKERTHLCSPPSLSHLISLSASIDTLIHLLHHFITSKNSVLPPSILLFNLSLILLISSSAASSLYDILYLCLLLEEDGKLFLMFSEDETVNLNKSKTCETPQQFLVWIINKYSQKALSLIYFKHLQNYLPANKETPGRRFKVVNIKLTLWWFQSVQRAKSSAGNWIGCFSWADVGSRSVCTEAEVVAGRPRPCGKTEFSCSNRRCVPIQLQCDLFSDCGDGGSDEQDCKACKYGTSWL